MLNDLPDFLFERKDAQRQLLEKERSKPWPPGLTQGGLPIAGSGGAHSEALCSC